MVKLQLPKLTMGVRFPLSAPNRQAAACRFFRYVFGYLKFCSIFSDLNQNGTRQSQARFCAKFMCCRRYKTDVILRSKEAVLNCVVFSSYFFYGAALRQESWRSVIRDGFAFRRIFFGRTSAKIRRVCPPESRIIGKTALFKDFGRLSAECDLALSHCNPF